MRKLLSLIILIMTLTSCNFFRGSGIELEIENNSDDPITDVKFTTTEKLNATEFIKIENNESVSGFLKMDKNRSDGSYCLEFKRSNEQNESKEYGYYTNGGPLDNKIIFQIENDTIYAKTSQYQ